MFHASLFYCLVSLVQVWLLRCFVHSGQAGGPKSFTIIITQYIKIVNFLTISQEINLARILTISGFLLPHEQGTVACKVAVLKPRAWKSLSLSIYIYTHIYVHV